MNVWFVKHYNEGILDVTRREQDQGWSDDSVVHHITKEQHEDSASDGGSQIRRE